MAAALRGRARVLRFSLPSPCSGAPGRLLLRVQLPPSQGTVGEGLVEPVCCPPSRKLVVPPCFGGASPFPGGVTAVICTCV